MARRTGPHGSVIADHTGPEGSGWSRRGLLLGLVLSPLLPVPAQAEAERKGMMARTVRLDPMTLPGRTRYGLVRLQADLLLRERGSLAADLSMVNAMRPRIVGRLTQALSEEKPVARGADAADVTRLKARMTGICNEAIGENLVEDVLIVSLLVN